MLRIGITGHAGIPATTCHLVRTALRQELRPYVTAGPVHGISCLAHGADQIFARLVLDLGGTFEAVLPAADYPQAGFVPGLRGEFDELLTAARHLTWMPYDHVSDAAYMAASLEMLRRSDRVLAVWDGRPAAGFGGTADVVAAAHERRLPVTVVWPPGAVRR